LGMWYRMTLETSPFFETQIENSIEI